MLTQQFPRVNPFHPLAKGLVGCYLLKDGNPSGPFRDVSVNGYHASLGSGSSDLLEANRQGVRVTNDTSTLRFLETGNTVRKLDTATFYFRAMIEDNTWTSGGLAFETNASGGARWELIFANGNINLRFYKVVNWGSYANLESTGWTPDVGVWYDFVGTCDESGAMVIYANGVELNSTAGVTGEVDSDNLIIGNTGGKSTSGALAGWMERVIVWDRALTAKEVLSLTTDRDAMFRREVLIVLSEPSSGIDITAQSANHSLLFDSPAVTQDHEISPSESNHSVDFDSPTVTQDHELSPDETSHSVSFDSTSITQTHVLTVQDALHSLDFDLSTVTQTHQIVTQESLHGLVFDNGTITQTHVMSPDEASHTVTFDNTTVTANSIEIAVQESSHDLSFDSSTVTQTHVFNPSEASHSLTFAASSIAQTHQVNADSALHSLSFEELSLTQTVYYVASDSTHSVQFDNVTFTLEFNYSPDDALHALSFSEPTLSQTHFIIPEEANHSLIFDNTTISAGFGLKSIWGKDQLSFGSVIIGANRP